MLKRISLLLAFAIGLASCSSGDKKVPFDANSCKKIPPFYQKLGFNPQTSGFSTNERNVMGVVLVDFGTQPIRYYKDETWKNAGWMGPIAIDAGGNAYIGPAPKINVLDNPTEKQNVLYQIDAISGKMNSFIDLPLQAEPNEQNPFGILGLAYLCSKNVLYVASVMGSDRKNEKGTIYAVDITNKKVIDQIDNIDAIGLGVSYVSGYRKLYIGKARGSELFSISLNDDGSFSGKPKHELSFQGYGPRGDDKIRKIAFNANHEMEISLIGFNFNLIAPTEKQETKSTLIYNQTEEKWQFK